MVHGHLKFSGKSALENSWLMCATAKSFLYYLLFDCVCVCGREQHLTLTIFSIKYFTYQGKMSANQSNDPCVKFIKRKTDGRIQGGKQTLR